MADRINNLKERVKQTPVDELQIEEFSFVSFRINANNWGDSGLSPNRHPLNQRVINWSCWDIS